MRVVALTTNVSGDTVAALLVVAAILRLLGVGRQSRERCPVRLAARGENAALQLALVETLTRILKVGLGRFHGQTFLFEFELLEFMIHPRIFKRDGCGLFRDLLCLGLRFGCLRRLRLYFRCGHCTGWRCASAQNVFHVTHAFLSPPLGMWY